MPGGNLKRRSDDDLLRLFAASRELEPFDALAERRQDDVYRFVYLMTASPARARRLTVELFCTLYREPETFVGRGPLERVLLAAAVKIVESGGSDTSSGASASADRDGGETLVGEADRPGHRLLMGALSKLKRHHRAALVLAEYEGMTYDDIAAIMNTSASAVRSWVHGARLTMAESLGAVEVTS